VILINKRRYQSINQSSSSEIAVFDMSTAILRTTLKTTTPLIDATVNETLPLGDYRCLEFFHRVRFSSVVDSLLKELRSGLFVGHMSSLMKSTFSFSDGPCALARGPAEVSICDDGIFLGWQTTGPFPRRLDSSSLVGTVDLCGSIELISAKFEMLHIRRCAINISSSVVFC